MYYDKRIRYLSYYESDIKLQNAGYVRFQVRDSLCQMVIYVKGPRLMGSGDAGVYLLSKKQAGAERDGFYTGSRDSRLQKHLLGNLNICNGQGHCAVRMNAENMADSGLRYDEICGIKIELHEYQYLESQWSVVNFMPERPAAAQDESPGYKLRAPRNDNRSMERKKGENSRDGGWENRENKAAEAAPVEINLMVTPVSENARVEKLTLAEEGIPVKESMPAKGQEESIVTEMSEKDTGEAAAELSADGGEDKESAVFAEQTADKEDVSMQEMLEREIQREAAQPEEKTQPEQPEQGEREWEVSSAQEMTERESREQETDTSAEEEEIRPEEQALKPDKWEQLKKTYPVVHPIREEEEYLKIAPKDFVIFTEKYQALVHNSFLLHGYYNYKHLILGRKERDGRVIYYLGVPGTFHDREKTVAVMFGFEAFDGKREPAENGDFGYYLRRVEI